MIIYCCSFYQVPAYCMQMMNYHKVSEQDRIKFELSMLLTVIEESYNKQLSQFVSKAHFKNPFQKSHWEDHFWNCFRVILPSAFSRCSETNSSAPFNS